MNLRLICAMIFVTSFYSWNIEAEKILLCFYSSGALHKSGDARFTMDDIDPHLCTHLLYDVFELDIETRKTKVFSRFEKDKTKLIELKQLNPQLKVLVVLIVKPNLWNKAHLQLLTNSSHVDGLIKTVLDLLRLYEFNGIVLSFYPNKKEKVGFINLVKAFKKAFQPHLYLLAVDGSSSDKSLVNEGYDIPRLNKDVDLLLLRAFNLHDPSKEPNRAIHHSPLYKQLWDTENKNADFLVSQWINKGFLPNKILLGISLYGASWTLSSNKTTPPAPAFGPGPPGRYPFSPGFMSYYDICHAVKFKGWQVFQDPNKRMGPYAVSPGNQNRTWVGYDDPAMAVVKSKYILSKGLGGVAVGDIFFDDFRNKCGNGHNPMLTAIWNTLFANTLINNMSNFNSTNKDVKLSQLENVLYRQKVAFVFSLVVSISSCFTIIYMCFIIFQNTFKRAKIDIPSVHYTADYDDIL